MCQTGPVSADPDPTRTRILDVARALAREEGYDLGITEVTRRAGIGTSGLYKRFPSREALIRELLVEMLDYTHTHLAEVYKIDDAPKAIYEANLVGFRQVDVYGELATLTVAGHIPTEFLDVYPYEDLDRFFGALIKRGIAQGHFDPELDIRYAVKAWKSLVAPQPMREFLEQGYSPSDLAELTTRFLIAALSH